MGGNGTSTPFPVTGAQVAYAKKSSCITCTEDTPYQFHFTRKMAVDAAILLSGFDPNAPDYANLIWVPLHAAGGNEEFSAVFMSLAYYAGGLPAVASRMNATPSGPGWYPVCQGTKITGSDIWRNHAAGNVLAASSTSSTDFKDVALNLVLGTRLVQFIAGNNIKNSLFDPDSVNGVKIWNPTQVRQALLVPAAKFLSTSRAVTSKAFGTASAAADLGRLSAIRPGDYMWYPVTGDSHGLMVVGFGPIIEWGDYISLYEGPSQPPTPPKTAPLTRTPTADGYTFDVDPAYKLALSPGDPVPQAVVPGKIRDYTARFTQNLADKSQFLGVPYVVDWWGQDPRRQGPRPFYATDTSMPNRPPMDGNMQASDHPYWLFVPAPDDGFVACAYAYDINACGVIEVHPEQTVLPKILTGCGGA